MSRTRRILLLDLLVERSEFGHGGNQEVIQPIAREGDVDIFLLTPHMQSEESGITANEEGLYFIGEEDVPNWDHDYPSVSYTPLRAHETREDRRFGGGVE